MTRRYRVGRSLARAKASTPANHGAGGFWNAIEPAGNKVPHPAVIFLILLAAVIVLSHVLYMLGTSATCQTFELTTDKLVSNTVAVISLLTADGIRFLFTSMIRNFMSFGPVGVILASPPTPVTWSSSRWPLWAFLAVVALIALLTAPEGAPLRDPVTGAIVKTFAGLSGMIFLLLIIS